VSGPRLPNELDHAAIGQGRQRAFGLLHTDSELLLDHLAGQFHAFSQLIKNPVLAIRQRLQVGVGLLVRAYLAFQQLDEADKPGMQPLTLFLQLRFRLVVYHGNNSYSVDSPTRTHKGANG